MAVSHALRRLLCIRELVEEQDRVALESALGELNRLESTLKVTVARGSQGRKLVSASVQTGELPDRLAGLEETRSAVRSANSLSLRVEVAEREVVGLRDCFLARRVERRQAETLIQESEAADAVESARRAQQALDDWHRSRSFHAQQTAGQSHNSDCQSATTRTATLEDESTPSRTLEKNDLSERTYS